MTASRAVPSEALFIATIQIICEAARFGQNANRCAAMNPTIRSESPVWVGRQRARGLRSETCLKSAEKAAFYFINWCCVQELREIWVTRTANKLKIQQKTNKQKLSTELRNHLTGKQKSGVANEKTLLLKRYLYFIKTEICSFKWEAVAVKQKPLFLMSSTDNLICHNQTEENILYFAKTRNFVVIMRRDLHFLITRNVSINKKLL